MDVHNSAAAPVAAETHAPVETAPSASARRRWIVVALVLAAVAVIALAVLGGSREAPPAEGGQPKDRPVPVVAAPAAIADMPISLDALGTVTPLATVTVQTRIDGQLMQLGFREGQDVRKGDFLAEIDPRPYQIALEQAQAQLAKDQAQLKNAEVDVNRYRQLIAEDSIARQTLDTQEALVRQYRAQVQLDQAEVDNARLNLDYTRIVSPIDGRVGLRVVDVGNYIRTSDTDGLVVITQMHPITVVFTVPEDKLPMVLARQQRPLAVPVTAFDRSGDKQIATGTLATIDNKIDSTTGTVKMKAMFANNDERLYPNQFVNVRLIVDTLKGITVVPAGAVQRGASGAYVYVVEAGGTVAVRPVTPGVSDGTQTQITAGLAAGEQVVIDGVDRLREGSKVTLPATSPSATSPSAAGASPTVTSGSAASPTTPARSGGGS